MDPVVKEILHTNPILLMIYLIAWSTGSLGYPTNTYKSYMKAKRAPMAIWKAVVHNLWNSAYRLSTHIQVTFGYLNESVGLGFF